MAEDKATPKTAAKKAPKPAVKKVVKKAAKPGAEAAVKKTAAKPEVKPTAKPATGKVSVTLIRSKHGRLASHKACVAGLGLRRMHQTVEVIDTPENRGMINKVRYLLNVKEA
ncbi:MAG: 50S ribosomal protein L30 [Gammaproteobacteria bacterium]|nr:MAG: 50S ribosomal protein L30 [Gammaproteobacteria bacterium]